VKSRVRKVAREFRRMAKRDIFEELEQLRFDATQIRDHLRMAAAGSRDDDAIQVDEDGSFDLSEIRDDLQLVQQLEEGNINVNELINHDTRQNQIQMRFPHGGDLNAWQGRVLPSLFMNANSIVQGILAGNVQQGIQDIVVLNCATMEKTVSLMRHLKAWSQQTIEEQYKRRIQELEDTIQARELRLRELEATNDSHGAIIAETYATSFKDKFKKSLSCQIVGPGSHEVREAWLARGWEFFKTQHSDLKVFWSKYDDDFLKASDLAFAVKNRVEEDLSKISLDGFRTIKESVRDYMVSTIGFEAVNRHYDIEKHINEEGLRAVSTNSPERGAISASLPNRGW